MKKNFYILRRLASISCAKSGEWELDGRIISVAIYSINKDGKKVTFFIFGKWSFAIERRTQ